MKAQEISQAILDDKIIAIIRGVSAGQIIPATDALLRGGIRLIEITLEQGSPKSVETSCQIIRDVRAEFGDRILLGAGTVITSQQVDQAVEAGARYIISPNTSAEVIHRTKELGKISIPGALTPTEAVFAHQEGADFVKLFPGGLMGVKYISAMRSPLKYIPFLAVGNISLDNICDYLKAGVVGVGIGGELVSREAVAAGRYDRITEMAKAYVDKIKG